MNFSVNIPKNSTPKYLNLEFHQDLSDGNNTSVFYRIEGI